MKYLSGEADKAKRRQVLGAMLLAISVLSIIFLLLTNLLASQLSVFLFDNVKYSSFVRLTALWVVVSAYFSFFISYMRARSKIILLSIQQIIIALLTLVIVSILATQSIDLQWVVVSVIGVWIIFTVFFFIMVIR